MQQSIARISLISTLSFSIFLAFTLGLLHACMNLIIIITLGQFKPSQLIMVVLIPLFWIILNSVTVSFLVIEYNAWASKTGGIKVKLQ